MFVVSGSHYMLLSVLACVCTCAVLLKAADLSVKAFQCVGMVLLQEQQVLLRTVQLILQGHTRRGHYDDTRSHSHV